MLSKNIDYFKSKSVNIPQITILLDNGYHPEHLTIELQKIYPQIMTKIKFELLKNPSIKEKETQGKSEFIPLKTRWIIERSNYWIERCKILVKNFEITLGNATAKINLCFIRLMVKRLAASKMSNGFYKAYLASSASRKIACSYKSFST
ncbi:transposase [Microcoleus sp. B13-B6]